MSEMKRRSAWEMIRDGAEDFDSGPVFDAKEFAYAVLWLYRDGRISHISVRRLFQDFGIRNGIEEYLIRRNEDGKNMSVYDGVTGSLVGVYELGAGTLMLTRVPCKAVCTLLVSS